ncbi:MAG: amidohydrolase family protein [Gemmatimonadetes bacterium]|nr:amidohydrolase family protein [Gemmatimonadota bacterium]
MQPAVAVTGLLTVLATASAAGQPAIAITGARVIDGTGVAPMAGVTVVIRDGRIEAVGPEVRAPAGARVIRGEGLTVLPGLTDMHTHLTGGWDGEAVDFFGFRRMLGSLLYSGVTTVLDPGNVTSWVKQLKAEVDAGRLAGPRIHYVGPVNDGPRPLWPDISNAISTPAQLPHFVEVLKTAGVSFLKGYVGLSDSMLAALVDTAKTRGLRVIADVGGRNGSIGSARTGIAAFAHAGTQPVTDEAARYLAEHRIAVISTLAVYESFAGRRFRDLSFLDHPLLKDVLPPGYRTDLLAHRDRPRSGADSAAARRLGEALGTAMRNVKRLADAGVPILAGTDAPYPGDYYGEGLQRELELLVEAGLTPLQAIAAATGRAARFIDERADWGTVAPGKAADLLIVRGNPAERISDTRNVVAVLQRGVEVNRAALRFDPRREIDHRPSPLRPH